MNLYELYRKYYLPPVGVTPENRVFSLPHIIISTIIFIAIFFIFRSIVRRKNMSYSNKVLKISAWAMLLLEIFRISWNAYFHGLSITSFRFDFCNQICMFLPFVVIFGNKKIYPYIQLLAIAGGLTVLIYPLWVFYDYAGFHIMALQSLVSHGLMLLCGLIMPYASGQIPSAKTEYKDSLIGVSFVLVIAFVMSKLTGVNYLMMNNANGVPILSLIPYPWYFIVFFAIIYFLAKNLSVIYQDFLCVTAKLPLGSTNLYDTPELSHQDYQSLLNAERLKLYKLFRPFKYRKLKALTEGNSNEN